MHLTNSVLLQRKDSLNEQQKFQRTFGMLQYKAISNAKLLRLKMVLFLCKLTTIDGTKICIRKDWDRLVHPSYYHRYLLTDRPISASIDLYPMFSTRSMKLSKDNPMT
ncbi:hypothetical protein NPIL_86851 [Nephila pilipes]|uniref:Uncharacterized protein n=1 Tax=Nephila pilipes TaxID=299642 RepID=A0A8X6MDG4_NEPPI|nr:hypothetical protein NPIL_86851 [Nephila pilipes]